MNSEGSAVIDSDNSSSPAASGSSDMRDDSSSPEFTPPPVGEHNIERFGHQHNNSSEYSRSYQSVFSETANDDHHPFTHNRNWSASTNSRPVTATTSIAESYKDEDPADLAAAVGLLSCSYGTPKSGPLFLGQDVPPVPPLPEKYQAYHQSTLLQSRTQHRRHEDVDMGEESDAADHRSHDDDEMFALEE